jgi:hypothetical protein
LLSGQDYTAIGKNQHLTRNMTSAQALSSLVANQQSKAMYLQTEYNYSGPMQSKSTTNLNAQNQ